MEVNMDINTERMMEEMLKKHGVRIVDVLSKKYNFSKEEGLKHLNLSERKVKTSIENKEKIQSKIPIPFCGEKCSGNCEAIRLNHGLYTQCTNLGTEEVDDVILCKTCEKQIEKNSNGKPTYGYISDRVKLGNKFRDPKGKTPVQYGNIMEKLNISREDAEKEATKQGVIIPEDQFEVKKAQRGRPKKDTTTVDTSGSDEEPQKKTRGRPKKDKQVVSANTGENLIKELVTRAQTVETIEIPEPPPAPPPAPPVETSGDSSSDDEEELAVTEFKIAGKKYLKSADNTLYDFTTHEEIGTWNPKTKQIEEVDDDEDD